MKRTLLLLCTLAAGGALGCADPAADACDAYCDCHGCNDREYDECIIEVDAALDIADVYGCDEEAEELWACAVDRGYCENQQWRYDDVCAVEDDAVDWCVSRSSMLRHGYPNPNPG